MDEITEEQISYEDLVEQFHQLQENWDEAGAAMLRISSEERGFSLWSQIERGENGFSLDVTKSIALEVAKQSAGNPLLKRGFSLRLGNVFGKGMSVDGKVPPRYKSKMEGASLQRVLFSDEAFEENERCLYETGNLLVAYNRLTNRAIRLPLSEIHDVAQNPDDLDDVWFYLRSYSKTDLVSQKQVPVSEWYPVLEFAEENQLPTKLANTPVNSEWVVINLAVNRPHRGLWGIADAFSAMSYAWAYANYLRNAGQLLEALNTFAWKIVGKGKAAAQRQALQIVGNRAGTGPKAAVMTEGADMSALPKSGQVNMNDGLALAAMAASALEVPLVALTSDSSNAAGSYGAVASLDGPTTAAARTRQQKWAGFYHRVFRAMGMTDLVVNFPKISEDPIHRQVASLAVGRTTGAIYADEYRAAFLEATDVAPLHDSPPAVDEYARAANALGFIQAMQGLVDQLETGGDPLSRQGNGGVAGSLSGGDHTNRDQDTAPGTGSVNS